ncbi:MAG: hypothetical protein P1V21_05520, partial [Rhizobiaceae bacterium]|nr:hypothetical protein [Rhizobiaceae bacterium]
MVKRIPPQMESLRRFFKWFQAVEYCEVTPFSDLGFSRRSIYPKTGSHFSNLGFSRRSIYPKTGSHFS